MATQAKTAKAAGPATKGLRIVSKRDGFRRVGRAFDGTPAVIPLSELTADQVEQLTTEPMLVVTEVDVEPA